MKASLSASYEAMERRRFGSSDLVRNEREARELADIGSAM